LGPKKVRNLSLTLPSVFDQLAAAELHIELSNALQRGQSVNLEAQGIERLSTQALQLLVSAQQSFASEGLSLKLNGAQPHILRTIKDSGLGLIPPFAAHKDIN
jgi:chemotaxis protein CheX